MGIKAQAGHYLFQQGNWPLTGFGIQIEGKTVTKLHLMLKNTFRHTHSLTALWVWVSVHHKDIVGVLISVSLVSQGSVESLCEWSVFPSTSAGSSRHFAVFPEQVRHNWMRSDHQFNAQCHWSEEKPHNLILKFSSCGETAVNVNTMAVCSFQNIALVFWAVQHFSFWLNQWQNNQFVGNLFELIFFATPCGAARGTDV